MSSQQFTTFLVGGQLFGIEVESVQEIIRYQPMTPVPLSSPAVAGLINLRGEVIPAVDVRQRLAPWSRGAVEEPVNVVVRTGPARALIRGAYKLDTELLLALDVAGVVTIPPHLDGLTRPSPSTKGTAGHG
jgi:purine-binding chemotaxis protein CheW